MRGDAWTELVNRVPPKLHNVISFATVNGSEIIVQNVLRLEENFIVVRGRMGGTQDAGRILILPYDQIVSMALNTHLKADEVLAIVGSSGGLSTTDDVNNSSPAAFAEEDVEAATPQADAEEAAPLTEPAVAVEQEPRAAPVSKTLLLARLRQRLAEKGRSS